MKKFHLLFTIGIFTLLIPAILGVYLIMPMPGSQMHDTVGLAYFLHKYRIIFRTVGFLLIAFPLYKYWTAGKRKQKIASGIFTVFALLILILTSFFVRADYFF